MNTPGVATQSRPADHRPPLYSVDLFCADWAFGKPLLALVWVGVAASSGPRVSAFSLAGIAAWVLVDLLAYRIRRRALPPRPVWGRHNRWTVPLFFAAAIFSAAQAF